MALTPASVPRLVLHSAPPCTCPSPHLGTRLFPGSCMWVDPYNLILRLYTIFHSRHQCYGYHQDLHFCAVHTYKMNMKRKYMYTREVRSGENKNGFETHSMFLNSCTSSAAVGLLVGSSFVHLEYRVCRAGEDQDGRTRWPGRGMLPLTTSQRTIPKLQMSIFSVALLR